MQAESFASPAHKPTAVEVGDEVEDVADGGFEKRNDVRHDGYSVRQGMKQRRPASGTARRKNSGYFSPELLGNRTNGGDGFGSVVKHGKEILGGFPVLCAQASVACFLSLARLTHAGCHIN